MERIGKNGHAGWQEEQLFHLKCATDNSPEQIYRFNDWTSLGGSLPTNAGTLAQSLFWEDSSCLGQLKWVWQNY